MEKTMKYCAVNLSYFDPNEHDTVMKKIIKKEGGTNLEMSHNFGYHNHQKVICFDVTSPEHAKQIKKVIRKTLNSSWIDVREKTW